MGKFVIRQTAAGYRFALQAANGQTIATSEVYDSLAACRRGAESVRKCGAVAKEADLTEPGPVPSNPKFELFQDRAGEYRFRLKARNGQIIAVSEGYAAKAPCQKGIESVRKNAVDAELLIL